MGIIDYAIKFNSLTSTVRTMVDDTFAELKPEIVEANKTALLKGEKSDGTYLKRLNNPFYVDYKEGKGSFAASLDPPRADFKDKGDFQSKIQANIQGSVIKNTSTDSKTPKLIARDGKDIFGVQKEYYPQLRESFVTIFIKKVRAKLL